VSRSHGKRASRSATRIALLTLITSSGGACGDDGGKKDQDANVADTGTESEAGTNAPDASQADGGMDAAQRTDAGDSAVAADAGRDARVDAAVNAVPTLTTATARQVGRYGDDLRVDVSGSDAAKDIAAVALSLLNSAGAPIGAERVVALGTPITQPTGMSYVMVSRLFEMGAMGAIDVNTLATVKVTLVDGAGQRSSTLDAPMTKQPVVAESGACDDSYLQNRCATGLGCKGTPKTCKSGEAPVLTRVGYFDDELGRRILMEGTDPDGDVKTYKVTFLDMNDAPLMIDIDNDEATLESSFVGDVAATSQGTSYSVRRETSEEFVKLVKKVVVTMTDSGNRASAPVTSNLIGPAPSKNNGVACDPKGFDRCAAGTVCATTGSTSRCTILGAARTTACSAALVLNPAAGINSVRGSIKQPSLWDTPAGCTGTEINQSDAVVKLLLAEPAARVVITTDNPYTAFDSVLYALQACGDSPTIWDPRKSDMTDFWCLPDQEVPVKKPQPILELKNLEAGDYFIVVESQPSTDTTGDGFQLDVTVD
jgi:hypothetical protein